MLCLMISSLGGIVLSLFKMIKKIGVEITLPQETECLIKDINFLLNC